MSINKDVIKKFCELCDWNHQVWMICLAIEENSITKNIFRGECKGFFVRFNKIMLEYAILQLVKLHDPPIQNQKTNLTLKYIVEYGDWDSETRGQLETLYRKLEELGGKSGPLKSARNNIISHYDLETVVKEITLGAFDKGKEVEYFQVLQEFVNLIHEKSIGGPYPFDDFAKPDTDAFLKALSSSPRISLIGK